ncbi:MAG: PDZ domain-containing protein, partial [Planctomycetes bacterium]|nr:PDZ domain-containing protein [Planctomycetota bacterium]
IAYRVLNRVDEVQPGSPASQAGLQSGDVITKAEFILPKSSISKKIDPIEFGQEGQHNWPRFIEQIQALPSGTKIRLTYNRGDQTRDVTLAPEPTVGKFVPERGFRFEPIQRIRLAKSLANSSAWAITKRSAR